MKRDGIVPDILQDDFNPSVLLSIVYPTGTEVLLGNELTSDDTVDEPEIDFVPLNLPALQADNTGERPSAEVSYTLAMLDPDAPSRAEPQYRSFRHWVVRMDSDTACSWCTVALTEGDIRSPG